MARPKVTRSAYNCFVQLTAAASTTKASGFMATKMMETTAAIIAGIPCKLFTPHVSCSLILSARKGLIKNVQGLIIWVFAKTAVFLERAKN